MSALQWGIIIAHLAGLGIGWYLKYLHVGIPSEYLTAVQSFLVAHHRNNLANIVSGVSDGSKKES